MGGAVSGYLESPVTEKEVEDGISKLGLRYGGASMQGWRNANEDALSCEPDLSDDSALFAVYDGHGGAEIALYVAKYLPILLKTQYDFTSGKTEHALREAFLAVDKQITLDETVDELQTLAGTKCDDEDENDPAEKLKECQDLHEEAAMPLTDLLAKYKKQMADCIAEEMAANPEKFQGSGKGKGKKAKSEVEEDPIISTEDEDEAKKEAKEESVPEAKEKGVPGPGREGEAAAAVEGAAVEGAGDIVEEDAANGTKETNGAASEPAGTANGDVTEEDEDDGEYNEEEEEEEEDSEEESDDESGSDEDDSDEDDLEDELAPYDEREGYGSGTTACVAVIKDRVLTVANVGDSRCVLCSGGAAKDLSIDHKPENELEKARVEKAGGRITKDGRVNGGLNLSRALGDHQYKGNEDLAPQEQLISPMPDLQTHNLTDEDEFLLVACDGVWNVLSSDEAVVFVRQLLGEARDSDTCNKSWLSDIASKLLDKCIAPDTSGDGTGCDNMTCVIVLLNQDTQNKRKLHSDEEKTSPDSKKSKTS